MRTLLLWLLLAFVVQVSAAPINTTWTVPPQIQDSDMTCWITAGAMIYSAKNGMSIDAKGLANTLGGTWKSAYLGNQGLDPSDVEAFATALEMKSFPPANPSLVAWSGWIKKGPIWVGVLPPQGLHIWLVTGMHGDGTPMGTSVTYNDPADGKSYTVTFSKLATAIESVVLASGIKDLHPQIVFIE